MHCCSMWWLVLLMVRLQWYIKSKKFSLFYYKLGVFTVFFGLEPSKETYYLVVVLVWKTRRGYTRWKSKIDCPTVTRREHSSHCVQSMLGIFRAVEHPSLCINGFVV